MSLIPDLLLYAAAHPLPPQRKKEKPPTTKQKTEFKEARLKISVFGRPWKCRQKYVLFNDWIMWKQGWFFLRLIERNCTNYKNVFFFFLELTFLLGWPLTRPSVFFFLPPQKKVGGRWKFDIWLMQIIGEFCAPLSFWLSDAWPSSSELSAYFLHTSYPFLDKFSECCAFSLEKTSQLWWQAYWEKDRGEVWLGGREGEKEGRAPGMTKSGCSCCDIAFNVQNLTLTMSGALCGPYTLLTERLLKS